MRMSYAVPHSNGRFYLPGRVREWIQLHRDCRLHGRLVDAVEGPAIILSPIPVRDWAGCFRVIINTCERVGALHATLAALEAQHLNILHMIAAAASAAGDLSITAIVARMAAPTQSRTRAIRLGALETPKPDLVARQLERALERRLRPWLSTSAIYRDQQLTQLRTVRASPLLMLRALGGMQANPNGMLGQRLGTTFQPDFSINVRNGIIDLQQVFLTASPKTGLKERSLFDMMDHTGVSKSVSIVVTADPEDYHFRIGLLVPRPYMQINVPILVSSRRESSMMGITKEIVETFVGDSCKVNLYFSSSTTVEATTSGETGSHVRTRPDTCVERLRIRLVGDVTNIARDRAESSPSRRIVDEVTRKVKQLSSRKGGKNTRRVEIDRGDSGLHDVTVRPLLAPLVFIATNVKPNMPYEHVKMALDLFGTLKDLDLRPVFVPTLTGASTAKEQMTSLLTVCPMLVSLYLPEPEMRLNAKLPSGSATFSPSAWTMFEEAFMTSLSNRQVFRLLHEDVFPPPFVEPTLVLSFSSADQYASELKRLRARILACKDMDVWRRALVECSTKLTHQGVDLERIDRSDPERWLIDGLDRMGRWKDGTLQRERNVTASSNQLKPRRQAPHRQTSNVSAALNNLGSLTTGTARKGSAKGSGSSTGVRRPVNI